MTPRLADAREAHRRWHRCRLAAPGGDFQRIDHFLRVLETVGRRLGQRLVEEGLPAASRRRQARHRLLDVRDRGGQRVAAIEGQVAGQQFVADHAEAVEIGASVDVEAACLFGTHVAGRTHGRALARDPQVVAVVRDAEIGEQRTLVLVEQHVLGLDVAMHDAALVGLSQRVGERADHRGDARRRFAQVELGEIAVGQVRHGVEKLPVGGAADFVDRDDVRVLQARDGAGLLLEAGNGFVGRRLQDLHRHRSAQRRLDRQIHRGHAAAAERAHQAMPGDFEIGDGWGTCHARPLAVRHRDSSQKRVENPQAASQR